jgi:predicted O-methyltransferase YrrM
MNENRWSIVDNYIADRLLPADPILDAVLAANAEARLPSYDVSPPQGKFLNLVARMIGAKRILEIGTLGGYSTIWFARALPPDGLVVTLEADPRHAAVAQSNFARSGLAERIDLRVGAALQLLPGVEADKAGPFDLIFIDADKPNNPNYLAWAIKLGRPGALIIGDNVVRDGAVTDSDNPDPSVQGVRRFFDMLAAEPRLSATAIQTVGGKGWDGFAFAVLD